MEANGDSTTEPNKLYVIFTASEQRVVWFKREFDELAFLLYCFFVFHSLISIDSFYAKINEQLCRNECFIVDTCDIIVLEQDVSPLNCLILFALLSCGRQIWARTLKQLLGLAGLVRNIDRTPKYPRILLRTYRKSLGRNIWPHVIIRHVCKYFQLLALFGGIAVMKPLDW